MTTDIFLVTYPKDYPWLPYLFRSVDKYATNFGRLVMVLSEGDKEPENLPAYVSVHRCPRDDNDGLHFLQAIEKLRAFEYTTADRVMYVDSDCVFISPVDVGNFQMPRIVKTWEEVGDAQCWREPTKRILRFDPPYETMRRHPAVYPVGFLREVWQHIGGKEAITQLRRDGLTAVPEFNVLGNYAVANYGKGMDILIDGKDTLPPRIIRQFWSHGGVTPEVVAEMERLGLA